MHVHLNYQKAVVGVKADCLEKGPRPIGGMPSVGGLSKGS